MKIAFVSGGNGHLGFHLVQELLSAGYRVKASVRDLNSQLKISKLIQLKKSYSELEIVQMELNHRESIKKAVQGTHVLYHVAAPNKIWAKNPEQEIFEPIFQGTQNVIEEAIQCNEGKLEKIIFTSSCSNLGFKATTKTKTRDLDETDWNENLHADLFKAKFQAEKWAIEYTGKKNMPFVSLCIPLLIGGNFDRTPPGMRTLQDAYQKGIFAIPSGEWHVVDVRDAAIIHRLAWNHENAKGRYVVSGNRVNSCQLAEAVKRALPEKKLKILLLPNFVLDIACFLDWLIHGLTKKERNLTRAFLKDFKNIEQRLSGEKLKKEFPEFRFRSLEQTLSDLFSWFRTQK